MESIWFGHNLADIVVTGEETGGTLGLVVVHAPAGDQPPLHVHQREDEAFHVLDGELTLWAGGRVVVLGPGQHALAPKGVPHTYRVTSDGSARVLVASRPAGFEAFVRAVGDPAQAHELPHPVDPPDAERMARAAAAHGIEILGPPGMLPADLDSAAEAA